MQFGEIDMSEADHAAWVKAQRDPALWHQAAMAALAYRRTMYPSASLQ